MIKKIKDILQNIGSKTDSQGLGLDSTGGGSSSRSDQPWYKNKRKLIIASVTAIVFSSILGIGLGVGLPGSSAMEAKVIDKYANLTPVERLELARKEMNDLLLDPYKQGVESEELIEESETKLANLKKYYDAIKGTSDIREFNIEEIKLEIEQGEGALALKKLMNITYTKNDFPSFYHNQGILTNVYDRSLSEGYYESNRWLFIHFHLEFSDYHVFASQHASGGVVPERTKEIRNLVRGQTKSKEARDKVIQKQKIIEDWVKRWYYSTIHDELKTSLEIYLNIKGEVKDWLNSSWKIELDAAKTNLTAALTGDSVSEVSKLKDDIKYFISQIEDPNAEVTNSINTANTEIAKIPTNISNIIVADINTATPLLVSALAETNALAIINLRNRIENAKTQAPTGDTTTNEPYETAKEQLNKVNDRLKEIIDDQLTTSTTKLTNALKGTDQEAIEEAKEELLKVTNSVINTFSSNTKSLKEKADAELSKVDSRLKELKLDVIKARITKLKDDVKAYGSSSFDNNRGFVYARFRYTEEIRKYRDNEDLKDFVKEAEKDVASNALTSAISNFKNLLKARINTFPDDNVRKEIFLRRVRMQQWSVRAKKYAPELNEQINEVNKLIESIPLHISVSTINGRTISLNNAITSSNPTVIDVQNKIDQLRQSLQSITLNHQTITEAIEKANQKIAEANNKKNEIAATELQNEINGFKVSLNRFKESLEANNAVTIYNLKEQLDSLMEKYSSTDHAELPEIREEVNVQIEKYKKIYPLKLLNNLISDQTKYRNGQGNSYGTLTTILPKKTYYLISKIIEEANTDINYSNERRSLNDRLMNLRSQASFIDGSVYDGDSLGVIDQLLGGFDFDSVLREKTKVLYKSTIKQYEDIIPSLVSVKHKAIVYRDKKIGEDISEKTTALKTELDKTTENINISDIESKATELQNLVNQNSSFYKPPSIKGAVGNAKFQLKRVSGVINTKVRANFDAEETTETRNALISLINDKVTKLEDASSLKSVDYYKIITELTTLTNSITSTNTELESATTSASTALTTANTALTDKVKVETEALISTTIGTDKNLINNLIEQGNGLIKLMETLNNSSLAETKTNLQTSVNTWGTTIVTITKQEIASKIAEVREDMKSNSKIDSLISYYQLLSLEIAIEPDTTNYATEKSNIATLKTDRVARVKTQELYTSINENFRKFKRSLANFDPADIDTKKTSFETQINAVTNTDTAIQALITDARTELAKVESRKLQISLLKQTFELEVAIDSNDADQITAAITAYDAITIPTSLSTDSDIATLKTAGDAQKTAASTKLTELTSENTNSDS